MVQKYSHLLIHDEQNQPCRSGPVIISCNPSTGRLRSLSLQNRIIGSHSSLDAGIPSFVIFILDSVTEEKALLKIATGEE